MIPSRTPGLAVIEHPDHVVVLNLPRIEQQQSPYVFEGSAFLIWSLIDGQRTIDEIIAELVDVASAADDEATREAIEDDTRAFIAQLAELGLVVQDPGGM